MKVGDKVKLNPNCNNFKCGKGGVHWNEVGQIFYQSHEPKGKILVNFPSCHKKNIETKEYRNYKKLLKNIWKIHLADKGDNPKYYKWFIKYEKMCQKLLEYEMDNNLIWELGLRKNL